MSKKKITFKQFYKKAGIKDGMAATLYYKQFLLSGLTIKEWLSKES